MARPVGEKLTRQMECAASEEPPLYPVHVGDEAPRDCIAME
jgi:hypothetical protein